MHDVPPSLTDLVRRVRDDATGPVDLRGMDLGVPPKRRRGWTDELPAIAKRHLNVPLTLGMAIALVTVLVKMWDYGHEADDRAQAKVERTMLAHDRDGESHARLRGQLQSAQSRIELIEKQLIEIRAQIDKNVRQRRR